MAESLEFDVVHQYSIYKVGITVDATLQNGDFSVDINAKIDTGSTYCIFEKHYGERLDLDIKSGNPVRISTAGANFRVFGHELTLTVLGIETFSTVYFAEDESFNRNVLGRIGWLDRVKLGLIEQEGKLFLSKYSE